MSEVAEPERRVFIDVPAVALPKLMEALGGFVAEHNLTITVGEAGLEAAQAPEDSLRYNPDLATEMFDVGGDKVPVVTATHLKNFAQAKCDGDTTIGTRLASSLLGGLGLHLSPRVKPYVLMPEDGGDQVELPSAVGIRVDRMQSLVSLIQSGELHVRHVGEKGTDLLGLYLSELFGPLADEALIQSPLD